MRMIERWFPCTEVSDASGSGWGSGQSEKALFSWFAARPLAQAKAAILTSLLPWPTDRAEQRRLQDIVRRAMTGYSVAGNEIAAELARLYPMGAFIADPFSGRAMIPLEAANIGVHALGLDYSPVATIGGRLLAEYPLRDWSDEMRLPYEQAPTTLSSHRLVEDVTCILHEVGRRHRAAMSELFPMHDNALPWGYLWAVTLPCQECGKRFPLVKSLVLRHADPKKGDLGQSYFLETEPQRGALRVVIHDGPPTSTPSLRSISKNDKKAAGKVAICPFCDHVHSKDLHTRLASEGAGRDQLLLAADINKRFGKYFRLPTLEEVRAADLAQAALAVEPQFAFDLPAMPVESIPPGNNHTIQASFYGAKRYCDMMNARQTLSFARLSRVISDVGQELLEHGISDAYATALCSYAAAVLVRKLNYSTRGAVLQSKRPPASNSVMVNHLFAHEASLAFSYDYFETGIGEGPGTWFSLAGDTIRILRHQVDRAGGHAATIQRGSALSLPLRDSTVDAVITDPPYDQLIPYSDASDLYYVWMKRALTSTSPEFSITSHGSGVQEKTEEIIVKKNRGYSGDHRTPEHYDRLIAAAFREARRVVRGDGVVTIVFGHGEPEVWHRLLKALTSADLVLTGSWPAKTESSGGSGSANIVTTLTMSCRPAPPSRSPGRAGAVETEVRREVHERIPMWEAAGLAFADQAMASAGPAMEIVGRYSEIFNHLGEAVDPAQYLIVARRAVQESAAIQIDTLPLEAFDSRTRFALYWVRLYARNVAAKSEARWEALAADLSADTLRALHVDVEKGVRFRYASELRVSVTETSSTIDVALAMAHAWKEGLDAVGQVLFSAGRQAEDTQLWAALAFLSTRFTEADPDAIAWTALVRNRRGIKTATRDIGVSREQAAKKAADETRQASLFESPSVTAVKETVY